MLPPLQGPASLECEVSPPGLNGCWFGFFCSTEKYNKGYPPQAQSIHIDEAGQP